MGPGWASGAAAAGEIRGERDGRAGRQRRGGYARAEGEDDGQVGAGRRHREGDARGRVSQLGLRLAALVLYMGQKQIMAIRCDRTA